ncbi:HNH endonuclease [Paracoccus suum]|nr:HNH endonuclease signature motif containing protein [Paracoccus suum]
MSLITEYRDLEANITALETARASSRGGDYEIYRSLVSKGRVLLPYLSGDGIAFGPSRFLGYKDNTVSEHVKREQLDGRETTPRIRQVLSKQFGFTITNTPDDAVDRLFHRFCSSLRAEPDNAARTFWITPEVANWLADHLGDEEAFISHGTNNVDEIEERVLRDETLPATTRDAIIKARVGQGLFRRRVLQSYGSCLVTGLNEQRLLVASHIKPWRDCWDNPNECLSADNALLLSPTWDALFDKGFVSFSDGGELLVSERLSSNSKRALGVKGLTVSLSAGQISHMRHHRNIYQFGD